MTDEQIEAAARELCRLRGDDPDGWDEWTFRDNATPSRCERWKIAAAEVRNHAMIEAAIGHAKAERAIERAQAAADRQIACQARAAERIGAIKARTHEGSTVAVRFHALPENRPAWAESMRADGRFVTLAGSFDEARGLSEIIFDEIGQAIHDYRQIGIYRADDEDRACGKTWLEIQATLNRARLPK